MLCYPGNARLSELTDIVHDKRDRMRAAKSSLGKAATVTCIACQLLWEYVGHLFVLGLIALLTYPFLYYNWSCYAPFWSCPLARLLTKSRTPSPTRWTDSLFSSRKTAYCPAA